MVQIIVLAIKKFDEAFQIAILSVIKYRFEKERENRVQGIEACCKKYPFPSAQFEWNRFDFSFQYPEWTIYTRPGFNFQQESRFPRVFQCFNAIARRN